MFRAIMCPSSGENNVPMRHLVFVTLYSRPFGLVCRAFRLHPRPNGQLYRVTNTRCRIGTVFSPDDGHSCPKHVEKSNKLIKKICAPSWFYLQKITHSGCLTVIASLLHQWFNERASVLHCTYPACLVSSQVNKTPASNNS